jgi:hypothetical protein
MKSLPALSKSRTVSVKSLELNRKARPFGLHEYPLKAYSKIPRKVFHANLLFFSFKAIITKGTLKHIFLFFYLIFSYK